MGLCRKKTTCTPLGREERNARYAARRRVLRSTAFLATLALTTTAAFDEALSLNLADRVPRRIERPLFIISRTSADVSLAFLRSILAGELGASLAAAAENRFFTAGSEIGRA